MQKLIGIERRVSEDKERVTGHKQKIVSANQKGCKRGGFGQGHDRIEERERVQRERGRGQR